MMDSLSNNDTPPSKVNYIGLFLVFFPPGLGGFIFGYDIGAVSYVLSMLRQSSSTTNYVWWEDLYASHLHQGMIVSAIWLGALAGSHIVYFWLDDKRVGRRTVIQLCVLVYIIGDALNVLAGTGLRSIRPSWIGMWCLILGRFTFGIGVGFIMLAVSV